jgi:hypothetical protein
VFRLSFILLLSVFVASASSRADAQAERKTGALADGAVAQPSSPAGYEAAIDLALAEFERGNFAEAREEFLRAHKIFPNARTLRAMGKAEFELKSYVDAQTHLSLALASQVRPLTSAQRSEAEALLERARQHVGRYTFVLVPDEAELTLDGSPAPLDSTRSLTLGEGSYQLALRAEGYTPLRRDLRVVGGVDKRLTLELSPVVSELPPPVSPAARTRAAPTRSDARPLRRQWWLWTGLAAVVVAGAAVGLVLALREPSPRQASGGSTQVVIDLGRPALATF